MGGPRDRTTSDTGGDPSAARAPAPEDLRALWDASRSAVVVLGADLRIRCANMGFASAAMERSAALEGTTLREVQPLFADATGALVAQALATGAPVLGAPLASAIADLSVDVLPVGTGGPDPHAVAAFYESPRSWLTAPDGMPRDRRRLVEVARRMTWASPEEAADVIHDALRFAVETFDLERGYVRLLAEADARYFTPYEHHRPDLPPLSPGEIELEAKSSALARFTRGEIVVLSSLDQVPAGEETFRAALERAGIRAIVAVPVLDGPRVLGFVAYTAAEGRRWAGWAVEILRLLGEMVGAVIHRVEANAAQEDRLRFQGILTEAARRTLVTAPEDIDAEICHLFQRLGEGGRVARALVMQVEAGETLAVTHEWCAPGVPSQRSIFDGVRCKRLPPPVRRALAGEVVAATAQEARPGSELWALLRTMQVHGFVLAPLSGEGRARGLLLMQTARTTPYHDRLPLSAHVASVKLVAEFVVAAFTHRSARERVRNLERRFERMVQSAMDGVVLVDAAGVVKEWTPQAASVFGSSRAEMLGKDLASVIHDRDRPTLAARLASAVAARETAQRFELTAKGADGRLVPIELSVTRLEEAEGVRVACFVRDVTDRKHAEAERQRAFDEVARQKSALQRERDYLREERGPSVILGESPAIRRAIELVDVVADTDSSVLLLGESGVGKELFAAALHARSARARAPFVKVNCPSVSGSLFESEFFGHVKGSFTGAFKDRVGRFELADGGTLFLDEVGEIPLELQAKLLRAIQEGEIERVGEERTRRLDVRIVAATNRDLAREVEAGRFRRDLYFRLGVFPILIPPLRERGDDVLLLARQFLARRSAALGATPPPLSADDEARLRAYDWPGNVRELEHVIERALILARARSRAPGGPLPLDLALPSRSAPPPSEPTEILTAEELRRLERDNLALALKRANGRVSGAGGAAELLGVNPSTLRDRMKVLRVSRTD